MFLPSAAVLTKRRGADVLAELPRGTVTFLFTDIDGGTSLWERCRATILAAVELHLVLLRTACTSARELSRHDCGPTSPRPGSLTISKGGSSQQRPRSRARGW